MIPLPPSPPPADPPPPRDADLVRCLSVRIFAMILGKTERSQTNQALRKTSLEPQGLPPCDSNFATPQLPSVSLLASGDAA